MIRDIKELNFPKYATLSQANIRISDMGDMTIEADVKIDGNKSPDFTYDWKVEFKGETYIMPLRKPQGSKDNTSVNSVVSLTFHHWAIYELKRYFFVTTTNDESGVVVADQYEASMSLNLKDFVAALNNVLSHYFGGKIAAVLNPSWGGSDEAKILDLSYTKVWDVLTSVYDLYAVRWYIETGEDGVCYIKIGYPTQNITHVFKYGYEGGLLKVERQVQSSDIYNVILGRGGSINLPLRYFKDVDSQNPSFASDPDWIPELSNIYFTGLRDAAFRSYVQGWKKKHYGGTVEKTAAYVKWAYEKGYTDTKFNPTEYVKSDESIKSYGEIWGAVENNEEIYPTIRNFTLPLIGRVDELVDVEEITEHIDTEGDYEELPVAGRKFNSIKDIPIGGKGEAKTPLGTFTIPQGKIGNFVEPIVDYGIRHSDRTQNEAIKNPVSIPDFVYKIYNTKGEQIPLSGIPEGTYTIEATCTLVNKEGFQIKIDYEYRDTIVQSATPKEDYNPYVFSIWVKNLWNTYKENGETAEQYAARVWNPILGDRSENEAIVKFAEGLLAVSSDYEFKIVKLPEFDDSKRFNDVESHWKITLSRSDADMESTGEYVPNKRINARAGEHFYFQGVDLPYMYYTEAEKRLTDYKELKLRETEDIKPTWVVNLDRVRISKVLEGESTPLLNELKIGRSIYLEDSRFITSKNSLGDIVPTAPESLYIQSITYTYRQPSSNDAALIPDVEIVLSDSYLTTADKMSMIENEVDAMRNQIDAISNVTTSVFNTGDKRYLRKDISDTTPYLLRLLGGAKSIFIRSVNAVLGLKGKGFSITENSNNEGEIETDHLLVRRRTVMSDVTLDKLSSSTFVDGFSGEGFMLHKDINNGDWSLSLDNIMVRKTMRIFELVISKIRAVFGQLVISAGQGRIKHVSKDETGDFYFITFEEVTGFKTDDLIRCQTWNGSTIKSYWVRVQFVSSNPEIFVVPVSEFGDAAPEPGDECVLMGNTSNPKRQNMLSMAATDDGQPRFDVLNHIDKKSFDGSLRARLGCLDGIKDDYFPADDQPRGDGLYCDNAYIKGRLLLSNGEDVKTKFEITEGKIQTSIESIRKDFDTSKCILSNPNFAKDLLGWTAATNDGNLKRDEKFIWSNGFIMSEHTTDTWAKIAMDGGRKVVHLNKSVLIQSSSNYAMTPEIHVNADGKKIPTVVYLSIMYKVEGNSRSASYGFVNENIEDMEEGYVSPSGQLVLQASDDYQMVSTSFKWSGTGDFIFSFVEGSVKISMIILSEDKSEAFAYRYKTFFEQSDKLIKIGAQNFDNDGNVIEESDIITSTKYVNLMSNYFNEDGSLKNSAGLVVTTDFEEAITDLNNELINQGDILEMLNDGQQSISNDLNNNYVKISSFSGLFASEVDSQGVATTAMIAAFVTSDEVDNKISHIVLSADQIHLEGYTTINGNFHIDAQGNATMNNATVTGTINATSGTIGGFTINGNQISTTTTGSIRIGDTSFYSVYGTSSSTKSIKVNGNPNGVTLKDYTFSYKENSSYVLGIQTYANYNWLNYLVANRYNITFHSGTSSNTSSDNRYGYQYAMLGSGHVCMDGIVEGACIDILSAFTAENQVYVIQPPLWCNRIVVAANYDNDVVVLPDYFSILSCLGNKVTFNSDSHMFTFRIILINTGKFIKVYGRSTLQLGSETPFNREEFPVLYYQGKDVTYWELDTNRTIEILLVRDNSGYKGFLLKD